MKQSYYDIKYHYQTLWLLLKNYVYKKVLEIYTTNIKNV